MRRILIACEESGRVRDAFTRMGYYAVSCDFKPSRTPGMHYQGNVLDILHAYKWDDLVAFPDCTYLTISAEWAYKDPDFDRYPGVGYHQRVKAGTLTGGGSPGGPQAGARLCGNPLECAGLARGHRKPYRGALFPVSETVSGDPTAPVWRGRQ